MSEHQQLEYKKALREILLNAIIHKDYSSGIPIQISVYDNKVYCWNDGRLPDGWTVKRLLEKHPSKPFNPLIANTFFRAGQIESWGRGIEKIKNECLAAGVKGPVFKYEETGLMVEIEGEIPADMSAGKRPSEAADSGKMSGKVSGKTSGKISGKILDLIQGNPMLTIAEIAAEISRTERTVLRYLKSLQIDGQLVRVGSRKEGHWKVKGDAFALKDSDESLVEAGDADKISGETSE